MFSSFVPLSRKCQKNSDDMAPTTAEAITDLWGLEIIVFKVIAVVVSMWELKAIILSIYSLSVASRSAQLHLESKRRGCFSFTVYAGNGNWHVNSPSVHHVASTNRRDYAAETSAAVWRVMQRWYHGLWFTPAFPGALQTWQCKWRRGLGGWRKNKFMITWVCPDRWIIFPLSLYWRNIYWAFCLWSMAGHNYSLAMSLFLSMIERGSFTNFQFVSLCPCLLW